MRLIQGDSLRNIAKQYIEPGKGLRQRLAKLMSYFARVCHTIDAAHVCGFLHCDVKPHNILFDKFMNPYVIDWGLSAPINHQTPESTRTSLSETITGSLHDSVDGQVIGTPAFMSPEQARGERFKMSRQTDIFGLGATLFYILAGEPLRTGKDFSEIILQAKTDFTRRIEDVRKDIPRELSRICAKATAFDPANRYATAAELAADIESWIYGRSSEGGWFSRLSHLFLSTRNWRSA